MTAAEIINRLQELISCGLILPDTEVVVFDPYDGVSNIEIVELGSSGNTVEITLSEY